MTPTVRELLGEAIDGLAQIGVDTPELDAELLLAHALDVERSWLMAHPDYQLTPKQELSFQELLARRLAREPLAYITGHRWFYDVQLIVTPAVLIPRPETEELVHRALAWLKERPRAVLVDVGTGSGAIALAIAKHATEAHIYATDISSEALEIARLNAKRLGLAHRVKFLQGDLLTPLPEHVDILLANLPYIAEAERESLMPEVVACEPATALFSGESGLEHIAHLLAQAPDYLRPGGRILLEIGSNQAEAALALAGRAFPRAEREIIQDLAGRDRFLLVQDKPRKDQTV